ncbi:hypothetical protein Gogos_003001 [Gossypium gossypioides]|uniref:Nodulin-like domain-containing protein n=1 Tax=Gossypium gossypioides TaxID=34282 RepID=A0A7J9CKT9_GOSGO|nr:hypothetical protein [Gossypium gossypioides]
MAKLKLKAGSRPPWVGLAAALWVQISAGNATNFTLYSSALKSVSGLSQQQLTFLGVANDIGESVGLLPGIACNRFPPWTVLLVGVFACFLGYGVIWLDVSQTIHPLPYWVFVYGVIEPAKVRWDCYDIGKSSALYVSFGASSNTVIPHE